MRFGFGYLNKLLCFVSFSFFQKAENNRLKKCQLSKIL